MAFRKRTFSQLKHHIYHNTRPRIKVKFPSGVVVEGELTPSIGEDAVKVSVGGGWFKQGWAIVIRPRLVQYIGIEYLK